MKQPTTRNTALGLLALSALTLYVLACASFSPDDTQVLYPAFSGTNGGIGIARFDRKAKVSSMVFVPTDLPEAETNPVPPKMIRSQWLADGRRILCAWANPDQDDPLGLALLPWGSRSPVRLFTIPGKEMSRAVMIPPPIVGDQTFLLNSPAEVLRLDLVSGAVVRHDLETTNSEWTLYPSADYRSVFFVENRKATGQFVFGRLDPATFAAFPLFTFTNEPESGFSFTYDPAGERLAFFETEGDVRRLVVMAKGKPTLTRPLPDFANKACEVGDLVFSHAGDRLLGSYRRLREGSDESAFGLVEIPLAEGSVRETVLIPHCHVGSSEQSAAYFQAGISHDGRTAAAASTYLACLAEDFKPEDCALFFVDLSDPQRKVTKIPIPLPAHRGQIH